MFTHRNKELELAGMEPHKHETVDEMRECEDSHYSDPDIIEYDPDAAYERYLEDGGPAAGRIAAEADYERMVYGE
jgi:hypothetical protein